MDKVTEPGTPRGRPAVPLTVPVLLALAVWASALRHPGGRPPVAVGLPRVEAGTAAELAPAIRRSPRAVVYVGCEVSTYSVRAHEWFLTAAADTAPDGGPIRFFVIAEEMAEDSRAWAASFRDERLAMLGALGCGWVLWLEGGQIREVEPHAGYPGRSAQDIVERTRAVWP